MPRLARYRPHMAWLTLLLLLLSMAGCGEKSTSPSSLSDLFPDDESAPAWTPGREVEIYDRESLYDLVDGQADAFFAYGFEQVAARTYEHSDGFVLRVTLWQLATPRDAFGLFTYARAGTPVAVGNGGDTDPGRRLAFWQERYYVEMHSRDELPGGYLPAFATVASETLPSGGETPELIGHLPADGLEEGSTLFFHEEISFQDELWLGGDNLLGLSSGTNGVLGQYTLDKTLVHLLVVQYSGAEPALAAQSALDSADIEGLVAVSVQGDLMGVVFGAVDEATADALLADAIAPR